MKFIKFLGIGGSATALHYLILTGLVELQLATPVVASAIGYSISGIFNYLMNYYVTFQSNANHGNGALKFVTVAGIGLAINSMTIFLLVNLLSVHYLPAQVSATLLVLFWNFFAHKHWTYASDQGN